MPIIRGNDADPIDYCCCHYSSQPLHQSGKPCRMHGAYNDMCLIPPFQICRMADGDLTLAKRASSVTAIGRVRSHIGIPGNEKADQRAAYESALGRIAVVGRQQQEQA